jgi:N-acetylated-alpha-linked acidic dipeptidase
MNRFVRWLGAATFLACASLFCVAIFGQARGHDAIRGFSPARTEAERLLELKLQSIPDAARAEVDLRQLTSEPHMAGTEASHRVAEWLRDQYRSYGFEAEIVTYSVWLPQPREVKLELTAPSRKPLASPEPLVALDKSTSDDRVSVAFNIYSPSGEVTAPVMYVNYGMSEDYRDLDSLGISVEGKIILARYGKGYRGVKAKLGEEHKAAGLILYSDPQDDGSAVGETFPHGPWRPMGGIQRGSIFYSQLYPGDPLRPASGSAPDAKRIDPANASSLPHIPTLPISAQDASVILASLDGPRVPVGWQGSLPLAYHVGPGAAEVHMKLVMDYQQRPIYNVIAQLRSSDDDEWVVLGNHHDAWVFGAVDPGSGTATMLEVARSLGELARSGWKPRRTIVMCEWDGEEPGLLGSTAWVEANRVELQAKAVAYINTDVGVSGPNFTASATPSLKELVREVTREIPAPSGKRSVYDSWREHAAQEKVEATGSARPEAKAGPSDTAPIGNLGAGSDFSPFFDFAGIPSMDMGFSGSYGVYHSLYDDFYWMKQFGDPTFSYHTTLARIIGTITLRLDEADVLPFDYTAYASEIARATNELVSKASRLNEKDANLRVVTDAAAQLLASTTDASEALRGIAVTPLDPAKEKEINHALVSVEQALLSADGLAGRPWFKHTIFAPASYEGYAVELFPGPNEALDRRDATTLHRESDSLAAALRRAAARLDDVARLAQSPASPAPAQ